MATKDALARKAAEAAGLLDDGPPLTAKEAAALCGLPPSWLYQKAALKLVPHYRIGRYIRFDRRALAEWIAGQHVEVQGG